MKKLILLFITIHLFGCSGNDFIDMKDVYVTDNIAYMAKDSTPVNGKVRSFGYYKKPGAFAFLFGNKISYEGYYTDGIKDYKWLNFEPDKSLQEGRTNRIMMIKEIWDVGELLKMQYYGSMSKDDILMTKYYNGTQGEKDPSFRTDYFIQNNSSIDLYNGTILIKTQSNQLLGIATHCGRAVIPSENMVFNSIKLSKVENDVSLVTVYEQKSIHDDLWTFSEESIYNFKYTLIITDDLLD